MSFPDRHTVDTLLTILLFASVLAIVYVARAVIVIFCFAILFAYLIDPAVRFLQRHSLIFKNMRGPHVAEAYFALLIFIALIAHVLTSGPSGHGGTLVHGLTSINDRLSTGELATEMGNQYAWNEEQTLRLKTFLVQHHSTIQGLMGSAAQSAATVVGAIVVIPILALFFLSDGAKLVDQLIHIASTKERVEDLQSLAAEMNVMLRHYIRAKVILGGLSFAYASTALLILGFPHALTLGVLAGALEFIPMAGWMTAAATIISFGVLSHCHWIWMAALLGIWRMLVDYWIAPRVLGHELELHPLLAIFALMVGGAVGGLPGVYLALPFVAAIRVVWHRVCLSRARQAARVATFPSALKSG